MTPRVVFELNAPGAGNEQGVYRNATHRFIPEALKVLDDKGAVIREDTVIHRFSGEKYLDSMRCQAEDGASIHITGMGVLDDGIVLMPWNDSTGYDLVEFRYKPGTITKSSTKVVGLPLPGNVQISLSPTKTRCVLRRIETDVETYTRRATDEVRSGEVDRIFGTPVVVQRRPDRIVNGFGLHDYTLLIATGVAMGTAKVEEYDLAKGELVKIHDGTKYGPLPGEKWGWIELESIDGFLIGVKMGSGDKRRMRGVEHGL